MGSRPETRKERGFCEKSCLALALIEGRCRQQPLEGGLALAWHRAELQ